MDNKDMKTRIRLEWPRENDYVFLTKKVASESPELAAEMETGGIIKRVDGNGIAEVHVTKVLKIDVAKLTIRP